ncbi:hypothetical protein M8C21_019914 [Ambrosia artemisiifolia]|uniref:Uncharacterized protein n=1 Tax=Ambrosia artemisiifolia TaxID=4212 RepID=A0AAD5BLK1_AMBAR|nr:hypothetical protein M8C21_019914 [Ambrosia artemisiifolia]
MGRRTVSVHHRRAKQRRDAALEPEPHNSHNRRTTHLRVVAEALWDGPPSRKLGLYSCQKRHIRIQKTKYGRNQMPINNIGVGKEIANKITITTKSNERIRDYRVDWDLEGNQPTAGDHYPLQKMKRKDNDECS